MKWQQKEEKERRAAELGYASIEEAFINLYEIHQSLSKVARKMNVTPSGVKYILKKLGVARKERGGDNNGRSPSTRQEEVFSSMTPEKWYTAKQIPGYVPKQTSSNLWYLWKKGKIERKIYKEITTPRYMYMKP